LPHAALASALCLFATEANAAGFVWGEEYRVNELVYNGGCCGGHTPTLINYKVYGCTCLTNNYCDDSCCFCIEASMNPFACVLKKATCFDFYGFYFVNVLKEMFFSGIMCNVFKACPNEEDECEKNFLLGSGIFLALFFAIAISYNFISEKYQNDLVRSEREEIKESIHSFVETFSPKLHPNIQKIDNSIIVINTKIQNLQKLQSQFPAQTDVVQPKIAKLTELKKHLEQTLRNIQVQLRTAYVIHQANQIEGIGQSVFLDEILKQANEALQHAEAITISVGETTQ